MRYILFLAALTLALTSGAQVITTGLSSKTTCYQASISTTSAYQVNVSTSSGPYNTFLTVQNQSATDALFCGPTSAVTATDGFSIAAGASYTWTLQQAQPWYCIAATAAVTAEVCKAQ